MLTLIKRISIALLGVNQTLRINDLRLRIDGSDQGGRQYNSRESYEELVNPLYNFINGTFKPDLVLDIGANYGFTGLVLARRFTGAEIILIEPSKKLCKYIRQNFQLNSISNFKVVNAICGDTIKNNVRFSLNPHSSQDNRVIPASRNWKTETVPSVSIDSIVGEETKTDFVFIKIDTQGYEERVFSGGNRLFSQSNWLVKTEFAPHWLLSQGTDPVNFLKELIERFHVSELPRRFRFKGDSFHDLLKHRITVSEAEGFIDYIQSLNRDSLGWCDLLISPKDLYKDLVIS